MRDFLILVCFAAFFFMLGAVIADGTVNRKFHEKYYCKVVKELNTCAVYELKELENKK